MNDLEQPFSNLTKGAHNKYAFKINNVSLGIVNAIRRIILSEIPNVATSFDAYHPEDNDTNFIVNTSSLHNEFLGHRLSLIPIHLPPEVIDSYNTSRFKFVINEHNTGTTTKVITTEHIKIYAEDDRELTRDECERIFPKDIITNDYIIITKLKANLYNPENGEQLHVEYRARKNIAKKNAAWCPVSLCSYTFTVDPEAAAQGLKEKISSIEDEDDKNRAIKVFETLDKQRFYYKNEFNEPSHFDFVIESECALTPQYLVDKAFDIMISKLANLRDEGKVEIHAINEEQYLYAITINDEDHTLGNLVQVLVYDKFVRAKKDVTYVGYNMPHPLQQKVVLKVRFSKATDVMVFLQEVSRVSIETIRGLQGKWRALYGMQMSDAKPPPPPRRIISRKPQQNK